MSWTDTTWRYPLTAWRAGLHSPTEGSPSAARTAAAQRAWRTTILPNVVAGQYKVQPSIVSCAVQLHWMWVFEDLQAQPRNCIDMTMCLRTAVTTASPAFMTWLTTKASSAWQTSAACALQRSPSVLVQAMEHPQIAVGHACIRMLPAAPKQSRAIYAFAVDKAIDQRSALALCHLLECLPSVAVAMCGSPHTDPDTTAAQLFRRWLWTKVQQALTLSVMAWLADVAKQTPSLHALWPQWVMTWPGRPDASPWMSVWTWEHRLATNLAQALHHEDPTRALDLVRTSRVSTTADVCCSMVAEALAIILLTNARLAYLRFFDALPALLRVLDAAHDSTTAAPSLLTTTDMGAWTQEAVRIAAGSGVENHAAMRMLSWLMAYFPDCAASCLASPSTAQWFQSALDTSPPRFRRTMPEVLKLCPALPLHMRRWVLSTLRERRMSPSHVVGYLVHTGWTHECQNVSHIVVNTLLRPPKVMQDWMWWTRLVCRMWTMDGNGCTPHKLCDRLILHMTYQWMHQHMLEPPASFNEQVLQLPTPFRSWWALLEAHMATCPLPCDEQLHPALISVLLAAHKYEFVGLVQEMAAFVAELENATTIVTEVMDNFMASIHKAITDRATASRLRRHIDSAVAFLTPMPQFKALSAGVRVSYRHYKPIGKWRSVLVPVTEGLLCCGDAEERYESLISCFDTCSAQGVPTGLLPSSNTQTKIRRVLQNRRAPPSVWTAFRAMKTRIASRQQTQKQAQAKKQQTGRSNTT